MNCTGLKMGIDNLRLKDGMQAQFYWVLPPEQFGNFRKQNVGQGKDKEEVEKKVKQFALEIGFFGGGGSRSRKRAGRGRDSGGFIKGVGRSGSGGARSGGRKRR
jgi:uncharacterized membrane protein YgcG